MISPSTDLCKARPRKSVPAPKPCRTEIGVIFYQLSRVCLSRACLGKMIMLSAFPMSVPSLSWQNDRFRYENGSKRG